MVPNNQNLLERSFRKQYLNILRNQMTKLSRNQKNEICRETERLADKLIKENEAMIVDRAARTHIRMTTPVPASYRVLLPHFKDSESVISNREEAFGGIGKRWIKLYTRLMLRFSRDPFSRIIEVSKKRIENNYGRTFRFEYSGDGQNQFIITTKKCFYHDFFAANDIPELTYGFCNGDKNGFEEIKPEKHGFHFERPTTLGYGGSECPFKFTRTGHRR